MIPVSILALSIALAGQGSAYRLLGYPGFGSIVAAAGDLDSDGVQDFVLGDPGPGIREIPPMFWFVSGNDGRVLWSMTMPGQPRALYQAGGGMDLDGDGAADVLLEQHPIGDLPGSLFLISGRTGLVSPLGRVHEASKGEIGPTQAIGDMECHPIHSYWGTRRAMVRLGGKASSGATVAVGFDDYVEILEEDSGHRVRRINPDSTTGDDSGFGAAFASLSDIDEDGFDDLAVSEVFGGGSDGRVLAFSGKNGRQCWVAENPSTVALGRLGSCLSVLGDLDGDGICDLLVGTEGISGGLPGAAFILSGRNGSMIYGFRRSGSDLTVERAPRGCLTRR